MKDQLQDTVDWSQNQNFIGKTVRGFLLRKIIGSGAFGVVYKSFSKKINKDVAIKVIPLQKCRKSKKLKTLLQAEVKVMIECSNPNVIKCYESFDEDDNKFIVIQYCNSGNLHQYILQKDNINFMLQQEEAINILRQIINGFRGLHEVNALHRDFKLQNVLIHDGQFKIADLGFSKQLGKNQLTKTHLGTLQYMAPQILLKKEYDYKVDIWSIGVALYRMIFGQYPFNGEDYNMMIRNHKFTKPRYDYKQISENCKRFIQKCLIVDKEKRINWDQIYDHQLFKINALESSIRFRSILNTSFCKPYMRQQFLPDYDDIDLQEDLQQSIFTKKAKLKKLQKDFSQIQTKQRLKALQQYELMYLKKRNNIMFVPIHIAKKRNKIQIQGVPHELYIFLLLKDSNLKMKQLILSLQNKQDIFKSNKYFDYFVLSRKYQVILTNLRNDLQAILNLMKLCKHQLHGNFNPQLQKQFVNFDKINHKNWHQFLKEQVIEEYINLLIQNLSEQNKNKKNVVTMLQALQYFQKNIKKQINVQIFEEQISKIKDYQQEYSKILSKQNNDF